MKNIRTTLIILILILLLIPNFGSGKAVTSADFGGTLPIWSIIPFVGILLSIAIIPLFKPEWWEKNLFNVALMWSLVFLVPFAFGYGISSVALSLYKMVLLDYLPFIVLLWGLFAVSGSIMLKGSLVGSPKVNVILLLAGTLLASWIGTTGASMLMIRPILRANAHREKKVHVVVFFIFLVSNIGGCLTPMGDPPLFLGFLRGVPFFWTMQLAPILAINAVLLLAAFFLLDRHYYKKEIAAGHTPADISEKEPLRIVGLHNLIFLAIIIAAVIISGILGTSDLFTDAVTAEPKGVPFAYGINIPYASVIQIIIILLAGFLSVKTTSKDLHKENNFTWAPIKEVASLFIGIFITMLPTLAILHARGADLGFTEPWQYFWASGALSSFLDNAPTYLVFMTTASALPAASAGVGTLIGTIAPKLLLAVSAGSVFMGANTYIGNAPNFMVRSIAEENEVKMPSFFGYMSWSGRYLIPLFIIDTFVFFIL